LFKGCGEEIHIDWWALLGIKKPCEDDQRRGANHWTMATCIMDNLQDEFIVFI